MTRNINKLTGHLKLFSEVRKDRKLFFETGTYLGQGVAAALEAGYSRIISFEIEKSKAMEAATYFIEDDRVEIKHASSCSMQFVEAVKSIKEPSVFWLDAHPDGVGPNPLITELLFIGASPYAHGILIDDRRLFEKYRVTEDLLLSVLKAMGRMVKVSYMTVRERFPDDVMYLELVPNPAIRDTTT